MEFVRNSKTLTALGGAPFDVAEISDEEISEDPVESLDEWGLYAQALLLSNELMFVD
jgi:hypothetical protein